MSKEILGIIGQDPSVSNFNWLHVDIFRFLVIKRREIYGSSSKSISGFFEVLNLNQLFLKGCLHDGPRSYPMSYGRFFHGHTSMIRFLKQAKFKPSRPLTRCKPNVG